MAASGDTGSGRSIAEVKLKPGEILVRMYDVGFGDCFIVAYDCAKGRVKILIDCGSIAKRKTATQDVVKRLIRDITPPGQQPAVDVVIATHRHADHVSGFANELWDSVAVKEVWLPWTEHPTDPIATRIRTAQTSFATAIAGVFGVDAAMDLDAADSRNETDDEANAVPSRYLALNALSNDNAMTRLHSGFTGDPKRRFLPENVAIGEKVVTAALPELVAHVLGPSKAEGDVRDMDPPSDQSYLALKGGHSNPAEKVQPFPKEWIADVRGAGLSKNDKKSIREVNDNMLDVLAVALDKAINGTSLMLMLEVFGKHLLFPGDAQWGTWRRALDDESTTRLLKKTIFYKVGHHGSHNATPVRFVEEILDTKQKGARRAMISVRPKANWAEIPREPLIEALGGRIGKIARSDVVAAQQGFERFGDLFVDTVI